MAENKTIVVARGLGFSSILFLIFLTLQLCHHIDWPWYAIAAPLLISWGIALLFIMLVIIIAIFAGAAS